jgi:hypothetical protein
MFENVNWLAPATIVCADGCVDTLIVKAAVLTVIVLIVTADEVIEPVEIVLPVTCPVTVVQFEDGVVAIEIVPFEPKPEPTLPFNW